MGNENYLDGNAPELVFLYNLIANAPEVFIVEYVESIVSPNGEPASMQLVIKSNEDEINRTLQISLSLIPQAFNISEDLFHCYQQCNLSGYEGEHNLECEAKLFANFVLKGNGISATPNYPYFNDILSVFGLDGLNFGYKLGFNSILNSGLFSYLYQEGTNMFVEYNETHNIGGPLYRTISDSPPFSLLKFYNSFKIR